MPPKKRKTRSLTPAPKSPRTSRHASTENAGAAQKKQKRLNKKGDDGREIDTFCWICHKPGQDRKCDKCPRVYHNECIDESEEFNTVCPECQAESVDGTPFKHLNSEKLRKILHTCVIRVFLKKRDQNDLFMSWPESLGRDKLIKIIDSEILRDKINHAPYYKKTAEFYADVKFMYHNCVILFKNDSPEVKAAKKLRDDFKKELLDIEACPQCYYNLYCQDIVTTDPFVTLCDPPHEIVWAQLTGHPYWPAKCLKVVAATNGNKIAHVRFFGEHEKSDIPLKKCLHISLSHPKFKGSNIFDRRNSGPKSLRYQTAKEELLDYINLHKRVHNEFNFFDHQTPYTPVSPRYLDKDGQRRVVEVSINGNPNSAFTLRNGATMKLEANMIESESTGDDVMPQPAVLEISENFGTNFDVCDDENSIDPAIEHGQSQNSFNQSEKERVENVLADSNVTGRILRDNANIGPVSVTMTFEQEPSHPTGDGSDLMLSIGSLSENCSAVPCSSAMSPGNTPVLDLNSITSEDCTRVLNSIAHAEVTHPIEMTESISPENRLNVSVDSDQNLDRGENPHESGSGQINVINPQVIDISNFENMNVSENNAGNMAPSSDIDDDVIIIDPPSDDNAPIVPQQQTKHFNPTVVLQHILQDKPDLKKMFEFGKYATEAMFVRLWANSSRIPAAPERITAALEKYRRARDKNITLVREKNAIAEELKNITEEHKNSLIEITRLKSQIEEEQNKRLELEYRSKETPRNANLIISALKEKAEQAQKELDKIKAEKQKVDDALKEIQQEHGACAENKYDSNKISMYKVQDYCCVCESLASIHCCVNHNYCSLRHKEEDYENHRKSCLNPKKRRSKLEIQSTSVQSVTQTKFSQIEGAILFDVQQKSVATKTLIAGASTSHSENPPVKEMSVSKSESYSHHRALLPTPSSPPNRTLPVTSHSYFLKNRRRNR